VAAGVNINLNSDTWAADDVKLDAGQDIQGYGRVAGAGDLDAVAGQDIVLREDIDVAGNLTGDAGRDILFNATSGNTYAGSTLLLEATAMDVSIYGDAESAGDMVSNTGDIDIYSSDDTTHLSGDYVEAVCHFRRVMIMCCVARVLAMGPLRTAGRGCWRTRWSLHLFSRRLARGFWMLLRF